MLSPYCFRGILCAVTFCLLAVTSASAQWLVYELKFAPDEDSVNFNFYAGAYVIAPAQGGAAT
ncbi:MAG: hypothetical protein U0984_04390, partial [Prosthecobacter sp.]|nr:hypothetical protein [Prosthecobacter sp.]